jgi:hypothetical protein
MILIALPLLFAVRRWPGDLRGILKNLLAVLRAPTVCLGNPTLWVAPLVARMPRFTPPRRRPHRRSSARARISLGALVSASLLLPAALSAAASGARRFDISAGDAAVTLKQFAEQSAGQLLYTPDDVAGVQTHAVQGEFTPLAALDRMLHSTPLRARPDLPAKAIAITATAASRAPPRPSASVSANSPPSSSAPLSPAIPPSVKPRSPLLAFLSSLIATSALTQAQTAPSASPTKEETVTLSPFTVASDRDQGFVAASALAGGRLATDLKDTPAAYSVLTRDFIEALSLTTLTSAQQWTTGFNEIEDDGRQNQFGDGERIRRTFRGVQSNQQQIEFFPAYYDYDSYNLERFDFARGPNSILFGSGSMGGTANGLFKRANTAKSTGELTQAFSSWQSFRNTADLNWAISPKFAVRFNGMWDNANTWRDVEYYNRRAATITATYRPWKGANLRATAEKGHNHRNASLTFMGDKVSGWDGTTTFTGRILATPTNANASGISVFGANNYIFSPGVMGGAIVDWNGHAQTLGGNANAAVPVGGQLVVGPLANIDAQPILGAINLPSFTFQNVLRGAPKFSVPARTRSTSLGGDSWETTFDNLHLGFDQQIGKHLFLGASGNYSRSAILTHFTVARGLNNVYVDINRLLPNGHGQPQLPHALLGVHPGLRPRETPLAQWPRQRRPCVRRHVPRQLPFQPRSRLLQGEFLPHQIPHGGE